MRIIPVGSEAALVEVDGPRDALGLARWARSRGVASREVVPAACTVLLDGVDPSNLPALLERWRGDDPDPAGPLVELPVTYDGADLDAVARHWEMTRAEAVAAHTAREYVVAFCGFAPGFAYLSGLPESLAVPRLATPRPRVPAGSVALADTWCGVYPTGSPGGWRLLGRTDATLWDPAADQPALLAPGTRVRFREDA